MSKKELQVPENNFYTEEHIWVQQLDEKSSIFLVGITDYAQNQLNEIIFVGTPDVGDTFDANESFGDVESLKAVNELYMPVSGEIKAVNEELEDTPNLVNQSPYGSGWILQIEIDELTSIQNLLSASDYIELTGG